MSTVGVSVTKAVIPDSNPPKLFSETKIRKTVRKVSKLPKCSPVKSHSARPRTANSEANEANEANEPALDFPTRMKLKEKISDLQQLNNELRFKVTTAETKLRAKDSELIAAESLNKQIKHLLDKHINREQDQNSQILNLEKKVTRFYHLINELEEEKKQFQNLVRTNNELKENLVVKEAQILDLSSQIAAVKESLSATSIECTQLESQLDEVKKIPKNIEPMLNVRKNYINVLEEKVKHLEGQCANLSEENCTLKTGIDRLEKFRFHSFLSMMRKESTLLQDQY